jgi:hypothetical protein
MQQVQLNDTLYKEAERRAAEAGFPTVDEYVADVLTQEIVDDTDNFDHLFTPQVISELEQISATAKAGGKTYTSEEVREHFRKKSDEWRANHPK